MLKIGENMGNLSKSQVLEKYFNNSINRKSLRGFRNKTPEGNFISGWICLEPGEYLSSMLLTEIKTQDGKKIYCERFLRGMPKQHYYDENEWSLCEEGKFVCYICREKLDGTCLMLFALYDEEDNLIEVVPRTRGMAVASNHIVDMYNLIDKAQIEAFYYYPHNYDTILMFELNGILNRHEITNHQYYIDLRLIGASCDGEVYKHRDVLSIAYHNHFALPDELFSVFRTQEGWMIYARISRLHPYYTDNCDFEVRYESLGKCIDGLTEIIETINNNYKEKNGHIAIEGVVINGIDSQNNQRYVKVKPKSVMKLARLGNGIPRWAIRKETYKYFDEHGVLEVKEIYNKDSLDYLKFIKKNLLEEFPEDMVNSTKTEKKITNVFFDIWEAKTPDLTIQKIAQELADKYSDKSKAEIMKLFAQEYPSFKNKSRQVYGILVHLIKED